MLESNIDRTGSLDVVGFHKKSGFYTRPRKLEVCAAISVDTFVLDIDMLTILFVCSWQRLSTV